MYAHGRDHLGQIIANAPAAQDHHILDAQRVFAQEAEILRDRHHIRRYMHTVARFDHKIAARNDHAAIALHHGVQYLWNAVHLGCNFAQRATDHRVVLLRAELHHFHPAAGKGFDIIGKWEAQQAADFLRCGALRIDRHVDIQLMAQQIQAFIIFRIADARDGILRTQTLGHQAAEHIGFIAGRGGNDDIRLLRARVNQRFRVRAVAADAHDVQCILAALQRLLIYIHNHHIMPLAGQMLRQHMAYLAIANHQNSHVILRLAKQIAC